MKGHMVVDEEVMEHWKELNLPPFRQPKEFALSVSPRYPHHDAQKICL
jgi:hypothetical protein